MKRGYFANSCETISSEKEKFLRFFDIFLIQKVEEGSLYIFWKTNRNL